MLTLYLNSLLKKKNLSKEEAEDAMNALLETEDKQQIAAFLLALKAKGETSEELLGMVQALQKKAIAVKFPYPTLDIVGTGGDLAGTFNISTGSAILAAACGIPIAKLGNRSASSRSGSADVLEALGILLETTPETLRNCLEKVGITFIFYPHYYPSLKKLGVIRKELKTHTIFNLLGPLLNPAKVEYALIGVSNETALELMSSALLELGHLQRALVFYCKGPNGISLDELAPMGTIIAYDIHSHHRSYLELNPSSLGLTPCSLADLQGGDAQANATLLEEAFAGKPGAVAETLIFNAGAALWIFNKASSIKEGVCLARAVLKEGKALKVLEKWRQFSKHINYLNTIVVDKQKEVEQLIQTTKDDYNHPLNKILREGREQKHLFSQALKSSLLAVIAEVKRRSPSVGTIGEIKDPVHLALQYCQGGARVISVLTDTKSFGGSLQDLEKVAEALAEKHPKVATLRKDFIIHPLQLAEAALAGASAVLLIVHLLGENLKTFIKEANRLGLETLTEVHHLKELEIALKAGAPIIGINHRNLETFALHLELSDQLRPLIPSHIITVAESGIHTPETAQKMRSLGYDAILVGEALIRSKNPAELISRMQQKRLIKVKICRVTHPDDAAKAADLGADYIGIIFSNKSKHPISITQGIEISNVVKKHGAEPVAVFVDESLEEILSICKQAGIKTIQLHGGTSGDHLLTLAKDFKVFYKVSSKLDGSMDFSTLGSLPKNVTPLFDYYKPGSGKTFDWNTFHPPKDLSFILAGGLNPTNVSMAIKQLHPAIVDVASGVEGTEKGRKDPLLLKMFIETAKQGNL